MLEVIYLMKQVFWKKAREKIEGQVTPSNCGFFIGKRIMSPSVELSVTPTKAIAKILLNTTEGIFAKKMISSSDLSMEIKNEYKIDL